MQLFGYDQSEITNDLSTLSALAAETRFIGHCVSQGLAGNEKFFWPG